MLVKSCKENIAGFSELLQKVELETISNNNYCKNYLQHLLAHKNYYLKIYAYVLDEAIAATTLPVSEINILDIGTGNGLLALFTKYCGCKNVYACDVDAEFITAAENLSSQLELPIQKFIRGGLEEVKMELKEVVITAIISTDVIEHIYNLPDFFNQMKNLNPEMVSVMTTASNPKNKWKVKQLRIIQIRDEQVGYGGNEIETDGHASFLSLRKDIIQKEFENISAENLHQLAVACRGLIKADILNAVHLFKEKQILPIPADNYNTCHPFTGSFTERILDFKEYEKLYKEAGFSLKILPGFYNNKGSLKNILVNRLLNGLLKFLEFKISPFILLVGRKK